MPVPTELLKTLLLKQKQQTITEREMVLLRLYLATAGAEAALDAVDFSDMPEAAGQSYTPADVRYQRILQAIDQPAEARSPWRKWLIRAAAAVFLTAGSAALLHYLLPPSAAPVQMLTYRTGNGEIKVITLPDSSRVWLNARSVLHYPATFNAPQRQVTLEQGQAFFDVTHDIEHPFIVSSRQGVQTTVLGTSFTVRVDSNAANIQVAVKTGKVSVEQASHPLAVLMPGDQVDYDVQQSRAAVSKTDTATISQWTSGKIVFTQASFAAIAATMQQLYGLQVIAGNTTIPRNRYSLTIRYEADPVKLLEVISAINGNRYEWKNSTHTIAVLH